MKVKFKSYTAEQFEKQPGKSSLSYDDYKILQSQEISLSPTDEKTFKNENYISIGNISISSDFIETIEEPKISEAQQLVHKVVRESFVNSNEVVDVLMTGIELHKNVILYGRGGHGKSEMTELVLKTLYDNKFIKELPFVQAFGDGLTEDHLFGGMDIKKYRENGVLEYLTQYSFMNHEIVVFEEIFDAPAQVLLSLKDIITSKRFRKGNQNHPIKTKVIIGLTNKTKEEFNEKSDSLKALTERFPLTLKVEWRSYNRYDFMNLFLEVFKFDFYREHKEKLTVLSTIIDMNNSSGRSFISPRTAIWAAEIYCKGRSLEYISEIDPEILIEYNKKNLEETVAPKQITFIKNVETYIENFELDGYGESEEFFKVLNQIEIDAGNDPIDMSNLTSTLGGKKMGKLEKLEYLTNLMDKINFTASNFKIATDLKERLINMKQNLNK
jgi:MoxR-like ATPase